MNFPGHSLTLIVKATFDLKPGGSAVAAEEQPFPTGDEFYPGDEEKTGSPRYASDFACHKTRADLLLVGACHAPGDRPVPSCPATFRVGNKSKTLAVFGNRHWEKGLFSRKLSEPASFTRMELRYENSFGGKKFLTNPVGRGFAEEQDQAGENFWPVPNVEDPAHLIQGSGNHPEPAGFGPLGKMWALRHGKLGTYKGAYLKTRWPWFPEDFDWTHFNAAPPRGGVFADAEAIERLVTVGPDQALRQHQVRQVGFANFGEDLVCVHGLLRVGGVVSGSGGVWCVSTVLCLDVKWIVKTEDGWRHRVSSVA